MAIMDGVKNYMRSWLGIEEPNKVSIVVTGEKDFQTNCFKNKLWYVGTASEINQFYASLPNVTQRFWGAKSTSGIEIRKIHTGLPKLIVNTLTSIVMSDLTAIECDNDKWVQVAEENKIKDIIKKALKDVLIQGDGAFKISFDGEVSNFPIIEWFSADRIEFDCKRGRISEIIFNIPFIENKRNYLLKEHYGFGYVTYELFNEDKNVDLNSTAKTQNLSSVAFDNSLMLAVPFMVYESARYDNRGQSIFDNKEDNFDSFDEIYSQWIDALRSNRTKSYIPDTLIPRDNKGGLIKPNSFDNRFIALSSDMSEKGENKIVVENPAIQTDAYLGTYITALDLCLQGLISPSTLGIDTKKVDNAEAQREKEKTTLYTRQAIIDALMPTIKNLVQVTINSYQIQYKQPLKEVECNIIFGEYANPSFEAVVETLSNPNTPMSIEAKVEEMWGDSKEQVWKDDEVNRIKEERGIVSMEEPALGGTIDENSTN